MYPGCPYAPHQHRFWPSPSAPRPPRLAARAARPPVRPAGGGRPGILTAGIRPSWPRSPAGGPTDTRIRPVGRCLGAQPHVRAGRTRPGRPPPSPSSCAQSAGVPEARPGRLPRALLPPAGCGGWPGRTRAKTGRECAQARPSPPVPRPAGLRLRAGPAAVGQSARGVWPRAEARVALKGLPGGRGAGCGSGRGRQLTVFMFGRPTSEVELAKNRFPDPKCFWPGFPGRYCAKIQNLGEGEILGIWCTYGHPPLKSELNAAKKRVSTVPSYGRVEVQFTRYCRYFSFTRQAYLYT